ncbi:MAG TPA: amidohydrolase family protein [Rhodopila sp.]
MLDRVIRRARLADAPDLVEIGIAAGRIAAIGGDLGAGETPSLDAEACLVVPGLVESHLHLDKACILDRAAAAEGPVKEAVAATTRAKRDFTPEDVYARGRRVLERSIAQGTMRVRTHVELDPGIGLRGLEGVEALARDFAWAVDIEVCVFPQEGMLNNPGTEALLIEGLRRGARVLGACPYTDSDPEGQIDRIFAIARDFDVDIDMHLDMADGPEGMLAESVCRKTEEYGWGGRVVIGHASQLSFLPPARLDVVARRLASAGVGVVVLPATDLFLIGRSFDHAVPRGVPPVQHLHDHGVACAIATNNVLNPFTPYGDCSLLRMANLAANVAQIGSPERLGTCLEMVTTRAAALLRLPGYGIAVGHAADLVAIDVADPAGAVAEIALPLWGVKGGRVSFVRPRAVLYPPGA